MRIAQEFVIGVSRDAIWDVLADVDLVAGCIPGVELAPRSDDSADDEHAGWLTVKFGPKAIRLAGKVTYERDDERRVATIAGLGQDPRSRTRVKGALAVTLGEVTDRESTRVSAAGDMHVAGPLAALVEAGAQRIMDRLVVDFASNLRSALEARGHTPEGAA